MGSLGIARLFSRTILPISHQWTRSPTKATKLLHRVRAFSQTPPDETAFQVSLDVRHFTAKELEVKTFENTIIIEGNHEEHREDDSFVERHFVRKYTLPKECENSEITAELTPDGMLTLKIPAPQTAIEEDKYQTVPIQRIIEPGVEDASKSEGTEEEGEKQK
jgi:hypothetical protein